MPHIIIRRYIWGWRIGKSPMIYGWDFHLPQNVTQEEEWFENVLENAYKTASAARAAYEGACLRHDAEFGYEFPVPGGRDFALGDIWDGFPVAHCNEALKLLTKTFDKVVGPGVADLAMDSAADAAWDHEGVEGYECDEDPDLLDALSQYLGKAWEQVEEDFMTEALQSGSPLEIQIRLTPAR